MTYAAVDSPTIDLEFIGGQMKAHLIGPSAASLTDLENFFDGAVKVLPPPNGTNDTVADKAVSDALSTAGGGIVFIPPGTRLWGNFRPANNITYAGTGTASVLKRVGNAHVVEGAYDAALLSNVTWRDLKIDGDKFLGQSTGHCLKMENATNLLLENLQLFNAWEAGIGVGCNTMVNPGGKITIRRCWTHNPAHLASIDGQTWGGIYISGGDDNIVEGNWCTAGADGYQGYGIDIEPFQTITCDRVYVHNNFVYNGTIKIAPTSTATVSNAKVQSNQIVHIESQGSGAGIQLDGHIVGLMEILDNSIWTDETNSKMACIGQLVEHNGTVKINIHRNILTGLGPNEFFSGLGNLGGMYIEGAAFTDISDNQLWGIGYDSTDGAITIKVLGGNGRIANNYFHANAPTHATYSAGIRECPASFKLYGNIFDSSIIVPFPVGGPYQMDWPVPTANLPAAAAALDGLRLTEIVDATNRKIVTYGGGKRFKSASHAES